MTCRRIARGGRLLSVAASMAVILVMSTGVAIAQITSATLSGVVRDETGAVLPGATVDVVNLDTGAKRSVVADSAGAFVLPGLPPGRYSSAAMLSGFDSDVRTGLQLAVGQQASIALTLRVAGTSETVKVVATAQLVDTRSSSLSALVEEQQIEDLPLNGRNFVDLALLQPGVSSFRDRSTGGLSGRGQQININGAGSRSNSYLLDGANMKSFHGVAVSTAADTTLGVETVREFRVVTNAFSADYGRAMGGVINIVTKSGTNATHGAGFEFFRNSAMDARNFFDRGKNPPPFVRHQFGGIVGGPLVKGRTFYFTGLEILNEGLTVTQVTAVPDDAARAGGLGPINPAIVRFLDLMPRANGPNVGGGLAQHTFEFNRDTDEKFGQVRIDQTFSGVDSLFLRYTIDDAKRRLPTSFELFSNDQASRNQLVTLEEQHIFSTQLLNTARFSYSRLRLGLFGVTTIGSEFAFIPGQPTMGTLNIGGMPNFGPEGTNPQMVNMDYFTYSDDVAWTKGRHYLKSGVLVEKIVQDNSSSTNVRGSYSFPDLQRFLAGQPDRYTGLLPGAETARKRDALLLGVYLQDDFSVHPRLTLNLGARYEFVTVPKDREGRDSALRDLYTDATFVLSPLFVNPSLRNMGPRVGFAWNVFGDSRASVRGGAGLYYDTDGQYNSSILVANFAPPFAQQISIANPPFPAPVFDRAVKNRAARTIDYHMGQPRMWTWNLNLQREVFGDVTVLLGYAASRGHNLVRATEGNPAIPEIQADGTMFFPAVAPRRNPNWGAIDLRTTGGKSWYDALQFGATKRFSKGYSAQVSYTFGKTIDLTQGQLNLDTSNTSIFGQNPYDPMMDRARADFDVRHVLTANFSWQLPMGEGLTGAAAAFASGWQINGLGTFRTGVPFTPGISANWSRNGATSGADRPNLKAGRNRDNIILGSPDRYFDPTAFELPPPGYMGNAGRNMLSGFGVVNVDLSLVKNQRCRALGETGEIELRLEVFNISNHANFAAPNRTVFAGVRQDEAPLGGAGRVRSTVTDSRQVQLGVKVRF